MDDTCIQLRTPRSIWWPDWLYESMPYFYALAGLVIILISETPAGYGGGVLLLLAAAVILKMRKDYRNLKQTIMLAEDLMQFNNDSSG